MNIVEEKWTEIIQKLRFEYCLSNISYETWILPLKVYDVIDNTVFLSVNLKASVEHIKNKYLLPLRVCIAEVTGTEFDIKFISENDYSELDEMKKEIKQLKKELYALQGAPERK